jgi:hypothetical protein
MGPDEVRQALGDPDQTSDLDRNAPNNYSWSYSESGVEVMFVDGKVSAINKHDVPPPDDHLIDNATRITVGMTQDQVRNILGAPEHTEEQDTQDGVHEEHWQYWGSSKAEMPKVDVIFHGGVVDTVQKGES